jgi:capsular exopolysaccharide synthesis family protein
MSLIPSDLEARPLLTNGQMVPSGRGVDIYAVTGMLRRRKGTILLGLAVVLAIVVVLTSLLPKTFNSTATVLIDESSSGPAQVPVLDVLQRLGRGGPLETEIQLMRSRRVLESVVDSLDLHVLVESPSGSVRPREVFGMQFAADPEVKADVYRLHFLPDGGYVVRDAEWRKIAAERVTTSPLLLGGLRLPQVSRDIEGFVTIRIIPFSAAVDGLAARVSASRVQREAGLIRLSCNGPSPAEVHEVCQAVLETYVDLRTQMQRSEASVAAEFLQDQVGRVEEKLMAAEDSLRALRQRHAIAALDEQTTEEIRHFAEFKAQRDLLEAERAALANMIQQVELAPGTARTYRDLAGFPVFLKNPTITELMVSLIELENRRSELGVHRTSENREVAALDQRISSIEGQLRTIARKYEQGLTSQIGALEQTMGASQTRLSGIPFQQVELQRLERKSSLLDDLYRRFETRLREAEIAKAVELPNVKVVDAASIPLRPSSPNARLNLALGLLLGLGVGLALALYREVRQVRMYELARETALPLLAIIPRLRKAGPLLSSAPAVLPPVGSSAGGPAALTSRRSANGRRKPQKAVARGRNRAIALEAFRSLALDLQLSSWSSGNNGLHSVGVTSSSRGEGKTFTACNLALVRASHGLKTLLIDGDMRASGVSQFFKLQQSHYGLSDVLAGEVHVVDALVALQVDEGGLWILPAGRPTSRSARLLEHARLQSLLGWFKDPGAFDLVVIDAPPLNVLTDAATIAAHVDAVLVVLRGGVTDRQGLELTLSRLHRVNGKVAGVVLNDVAVPQAYATYSNDRNVR